MTEPELKEQPKKSSSLKPILIAGVGCLLLLIVMGFVLSFAGAWLMNTFGLTFLQSAIEKQTGVKSTISDIQKGQLSFTDDKTGQKVDIGAGKMPENFPSDMPVYPGAKVAGSMSGTGEKNGNGYWVTLSTSDTYDTVLSYYNDTLASNGWESENAMTLGNNTTALTVKKAGLAGTVTISQPKSGSDTAIVITLGKNDSAEGADPQ